MTLDGTYLLFVIAAFVILLAAEHFVIWARWNNQRRRVRAERVRQWRVVLNFRKAGLL